MQFYYLLIIDPYFGRFWSWFCCLGTTIFECSECVSIDQIACFWPKIFCWGLRPQTPAVRRPSARHATRASLARARFAHKWADRALGTLRVPRSQVCRPSARHATHASLAGEPEARWKKFQVPWKVLFSTAMEEIVSWMENSFLRKG